ncbi:MAG: hypothetical protein M5R36_08960 [Deltaproteobacteria bacterium]|nr:hypothetical protein [Deltaproteobacteria bacterium]
MPFAAGLFDDRFHFAGQIRIDRRFREQILGRGHLGGGLGVGAGFGARPGKRHAR